MASSTAAPAPAAGQSFCLKPQPLPRCQVVLLTNLGIHGIVGAATSGSAMRAVADWGPLINLTEHSAFGATWLVSADRDGLLTGPMVRYRYWYGDSTSLEVAVGTSIHHPQFDTYASAFGLLKWNPSPVIGVAVRPEWRRTTDYTCLDAPPYGCAPAGRATFAVSAGVEFSGAPGLVASGIAAALFGLFAAVYASISD